MVIYVKGKLDDSKFWHWCENCSKYPKKEEDMTKTIFDLPSEDLCPECYKKEQNDDCEDGSNGKKPAIGVNVDTGEVF